jgi:Xaa-Pro aminopeptidase
MSQTPVLTTTAEKLAALRELMTQNQLDGFLIPRADRLQNEYVSAADERLAWLLGFTGSAGLALVLAEQVILFVDGRYTVQAAQQTDPQLVQCVQIGGGLSYESWLAENLSANQRIGCDAWLHANGQYSRFENACAQASAELVGSDNLVDALWLDRPAAVANPIVAHTAEYAGQATSDKLAAVAQTLTANDVDATLLSATDSVAWLFNLRGSDIPYNPVFGAYAAVDAAGQAELFVDANRLTAEAQASLPAAVRISPVNDFTALLDKLGQANAAVQLDFTSIPAAIAQTLEDAGAELLNRQDPCVLPKAIKNPVEAEGARQAHIRDGVAVTKFLCWLDTARPAVATELSVAEQLRQTRVAVAEQFGVQLKDLSFNTISATGENAALPHYSASPEHDGDLKPGDIYLVDSGGQYLDGTTDITRTVILDELPAGDLAAEMRDRYTRVLKGHINLALARFPQGVSGSQLDAVARYALWQGGYDFDHGTGHGVGSYLCVHEGPQNISPRPNAQPLMPGMIVSNEPGYYKAGAYGIRIENLVLLVAPEGGERPMLGFETLTLAPIDRRLIDAEMLTTEERGWLNRYHQRVYTMLAPHLAAAEQQWLAEATATI